MEVNVEIAAEPNRWIKMKYASLIPPMRYFMDFGYQVLFKGNGFAYVWHDVLGILVLGSGLFACAVWRFRRLL